MNLHLAKNLSLLARAVIPFSAKINMNIQKEENFESIEFSGIQDINDIKSKSFYNCTFTNCDFTGSDFSFSLLSDCVFKDSNFSLIKLAETKIHNAHFIACKVLGVDFTQVSKLIFKIGFRESQITKCTFALLDMNESEFIDCTIYQSDFYQSKLKKSNFSDSDLKDTIFENTDLTETDFCNAKNYSINPMTNKVKNAEFTMPDAICLLDALEVKINF